MQHLTIAPCKWTRIPRLQGYKIREKWKQVVKERRKQEKESKEKKEPEENNFLYVVYKMFNFLYNLFWGVEEKNSLCPNSFSAMPGNKFHNFAIIRGEPDED